MNPLFFLAAFFAEVTGTIAGFGSSTIALPLALLFFDFKTALVLVAFLHIFGNIGRVTFFKHGLNRRIIILFGFPSVMMTLLGAVLVRYASQEILKAILGGFLIVYSTLSLWGNFKVKASNVSSIFGGSLSGFLAGLIGTGGALRATFLTAFGIPKEKYIATAAAIAIAVDLTRLPVYLLQGFLKKEFLIFVPTLFLIAILGSFIGRQVVKKVPQEVFTRIVLLAIFLGGIKFVFDLFH